MELEQESIVVVEDDLAHRSLIKSVLVSEGFIVYCAADGEGGLDLIRGVVPALVITDVMLPGLDGFELCRRLRSEPKTAGVALIFISARSGSQDLQEAVSLGADDYLAKPFKLGELLDRTRTVLRRVRKRREQEGPPVKQATAPVGQQMRPDMLLGGNLEAAGVIEVLQTVDSEHLNARLEIRGEGYGLLEIRQGRVVHSSLSTRKGQVLGLKAWLRLTSWRDGTFQMLYVPSAAATPERNMPDLPLPGLLMDAVFHRDDCVRLKAEFSERAFVFRQKGLTGEATPVEAQIWQSIGQGIYLNALLDELPLKDNEILQGVLQLRQRSILTSS